MKKSSLRLGLSILGILMASCVVGYELMEGFGPDLSAAAQIHKLESYWTTRRRAAATELAQFSGEPDKVVPALVKALGDSDTDVRLNALESLKTFGAKAKPAAPVLREILERDSDERIRRRAATLLGAIKDQTDVPVLVKALDDRDPEVRLEATRALGRFGFGVASAPILDKLLLGLGSDYPEQVRDATIDTLDSLARDQERVVRAIADVSAKDPSALVRNKAVGIMKKPTFAFQIPALVAALEDSSPQVRLTAGTNLAWIGLSDDRVVPALCQAALKADESTREGIGSNIDLLILGRTEDKTPDDQLARRYRSAVAAFETVLETPAAAAREQVVIVLCRLIATYQKTAKPALFEPAQAAVKAVLKRIEDEKEEVAIRLLAMKQCSVIHTVGDYHSVRAAESRSAVPSAEAQLHYRASWIAALGSALKSPVALVRSGALEALMDNFKDPLADSAFRHAWVTIVPTLAEVTTSEDLRVRNAALSLLAKLGPEAKEALPALKSLVQDPRAESVRPAAEGTIKSISCIDDLKANDPAVRIAAAETLGQLDWPAAVGIPALTSLLKDREIKVRIAAAHALRALAKLSGDAVTPLATALKAETDAGVRVAILEALEAIAPGSAAALDAHRTALHDPDPSVRTAAATFQKIPTDDSMIFALGSALSDPSDEVRLQLAGTLTEVLFANPAVIPTLLKALSDDKQRKTVMEALSHHLETTSDQTDFSRVRGDLPALKATLNNANPAIVQTLSLKDDEVSPLVYSLLGRIVSFASLSRDADVRKAIEPLVQVYLKGLDESAPAIREEVLDRIHAIPIRREDIVSALTKFLEKPDLPPKDRETASLALKEQSAPASSAARKGSSRKRAGGGGGLTRLTD